MFWKVFHLVRNTTSILLIHKILVFLFNLMVNSIRSKTNLKGTLVTLAFVIQRQTAVFEPE